MENPKADSLIAMFVFYSYSSGIQARLAFSKEFRHCNVITFDGRDWIVIDFDRTGLIARTIHCKGAESLLKTLPIIKEVTAIVTVDIKERSKYRWSPWWVRSCNEICRYRAGIDLSFTFNPAHLYYKLLKDRRRRNYRILAHWRRDHGTIRE
jgi:hypothetical protein